MDVATIKKDLENQLGDINKELENIYLPHDAVLIFLGKRTAFEIALELIDSLQQEQPDKDKKTFDDYLKASPSERRKMNMTEILGEEKLAETKKQMEQPEVDLEQTIHDKVVELHTAPSYDELRDFALYFYELDRNARKEDK